MTDSGASPLSAAHRELLDAMSRGGYVSLATRRAVIDLVESAEALQAQVDALTADLVAELTRRGAMPSCRCGKWQTYVGDYDRDGTTLRCHGCLRAIEKCRCR